MPQPGRRQQVKLSGTRESVRLREREAGARCARSGKNGGFWCSVAAREVMARKTNSRVLLNGQCKETEERRLRPP